MASVDSKRLGTQIAVYWVEEVQVWLEMQVECLVVCVELQPYEVVVLE